MDFKAQTPVVGMTNISDRERLFRYDVLFSFLASGDSLESINAHRKLFEKYGFKLTDATHLSDLIPMVHSQVGNFPTCHHHRYACEIHEKPRNIYADH